MDTTDAALGGRRQVVDNTAVVERAKAAEEAKGDLEKQRRRHACQLVRKWLTMLIILMSAWSSTP